ncbi:MAG: D-alanyl-D-alanine carboxypeptidase [Ruminococcus sp.]|nr:D-alanyl-D-alanine carboxypeptidase [Ruminococcus sp.]
MQKRLGSLCAILCTAMALSLIPVPVLQAQTALEITHEAGHELDEKYQPAASMIVELETGQILWQEEAKKEWAPASLTKIMTLLLVYDAMEEGKFTLDTEIEVTQKYVDIGTKSACSNNNMQLGAKYPVHELIELLIVPSSAAATQMLADYVEPDADKFLQMMNDKAQELGMTQTTYYNCIGVTTNLIAPYHPPSVELDTDNITSARDKMLLARHFLKTYPNVLEHSDEADIVTLEGTEYEEHFHSHHASLPGGTQEFEGTDGLKTGSSDTAGYNLIFTAKQKDTRLVQVVLGVSEWGDPNGEEYRHIVANALMQKAFDEYEYKLVLPAGEHKIDGKTIKTTRDLWDCVPKGEEISYKLVDDKISVDMEREYIDGGEAPSVSYKITFFSQFLKVLGTILKILLLIVLILILLIGGRIAYVAYVKHQRKKRRMQRRASALKDRKTAQEKNPEQ